MPTGSKIKKSLDINLGADTHLSSPDHGEGRDIIDKVRAWVVQNVPEDVLDASDNIISASKILGLDSPSTGGGVNPASIAQLSKDPLAPPAVKKALEFMTQRYPRLSKIVSSSRFIKNPDSVGTRGRYSFGTNGKDLVDHSTHSLLNDKGEARSAVEVLSNIGHEILGHGRDTLKTGALKSTGQMEDYLDLVKQEQNIFPYSVQPSEINAREMGGKLLRALAKRGQLPVGE